jgi:hypothetical protein
VTRRTIPIALAAASLFAATACGGSTAGQARPAPDTSAPAATTDTGTASSTPNSSSNTGSLDSRDPCSLLSQADYSSLDLNRQPEQSNLGTARGCKFGSHTGAMALDIRTNVGLAGVQTNGGQLTDTTVGRHEAKQLRSISGGCMITMGVTSSSRVDVTVNTGARTDPCPIALQLAQMVEPNLP